MGEPSTTLKPNSSRPPKLPKCKANLEVRRGPSVENSRVTFTRDVINSTILVINNLRLIPGWITSRIRSYRKDWLLIVPDMLWISLLLCLGLTYLYVVFVTAYYGTETRIFSTTVTLMAAGWVEKNFDSLVVIIFTVLVIVLLFWRAMRKVQHFLRAFLMALLLLIMAMLNMHFTQLAKNELIRLDYQHAARRADEFGQAGQYDQVASILNLFPQSYPASLVDAASIREMDTIYMYRQRWENEELEIDPFTKDLVLKNYHNTVLQYYYDGRYTDMLELTCSISTEEFRMPLLIFWRTATYRLAHDPSWGPETTIAWIDDLVSRNPRCAMLASPYWTAIPQGIAWFIDEKLTVDFTQLGRLYNRSEVEMPEDQPIEQTSPPTEIRKVCETYDAHMQLRCEYDSRLIDDLLTKYPNDPYVDYVKFIRGQYDLILSEGIAKNPNLYDQAYYRKGLAQFAQKDYEGALKTFQSFLFNDALQDHVWRDDARYRVAECYLNMGKYIDALENYVKANNEPDGKLPNYAQIGPNILYVADVLMPIVELESVVSMQVFTEYQPMLQYTLAERYLAERDYERARLTFQQVINEFGSKLIIPKLGYTYGELANRKLKVIEVLEYYEKNRGPDYPILVADYLDSFETFSPFENDLRYLIPMFESNLITEDYLNKRSRTLISIQMRSMFLNEYPTDSRAPELLFKLSKDYETVASWKNLPKSNEFFINTRNAAAARFLEYIQKYPDYNTEYLDYALEHSGSVYMLGCNMGECDILNVIAMRGVYLELVKQFPRHHLANNMLNWIAWSHCFEANEDFSVEENYVFAYQNALKIYKQIIANHPDGLTGENARESIKIIEIKLRDPANRTELPKPQWGWYNR